MKIICISDTHGRWNKLTIPECDILISAGDFSFRGEKHMVKDFHKWLDKQPARYVISVMGNHELWVEKNWSEAMLIAKEACPNVLHFIDEGYVEIEGIRIWCSAVTPFFCDWAWNRFRGEEIKRHWDKIPNDIDILITHGPPAGILDHINYADGTLKEHVGCLDLKDKIKELKNLKLHVFGHIHDASGIEVQDNITYINASICNDHYEVAYPPREYTYERIT